MLTWNVALEAPAETFTEPGTVRTEGTVSVIVTVRPPAPAGLVTVTVQVPDALERREVTPHCREVTVFEETSAIVAAALLPPSDAVSVAV